MLRRRRWAEALAVLSQGVASRPTSAATAMLARACLEVGQHRQALVALEGADVDALREPENARMFILALERVGRVDEARSRAADFLEIHPGDDMVRTFLQRLESFAGGVPQGPQRGADPYTTVRRAEAYVQVGRVDRALRAYRRILLYHPDDRHLVDRIQQLSIASSHAEGDLSGDLTDPDEVPAEPTLMAAPEDGSSASHTLPAGGLLSGDPTAHRDGLGSLQSYMDGEDIDDEETEIMGKEDPEDIAKKLGRRSLIRR